MSKEHPNITPSDWLDIYPPILFISHFEMTDNFASISKVDLDALVKGSRTHLPLSGSPVPLSYICETMLQASALTIYAHERQHEYKALVFNARTRLFKDIKKSSMSYVVHSTIVSNKRGIIKIEATLKRSNIICASGKFEYKSGHALSKDMQ